MIFFFKLKTAYDMRISGWSSDVCSSDLFLLCGRSHASPLACSTQESRWFGAPEPYLPRSGTHAGVWTCWPTPTAVAHVIRGWHHTGRMSTQAGISCPLRLPPRSEEHTSELQSLMRISDAVFCLQTTNTLIYINT